ncbi:galactose oxidase [Roridomyces roridus]|uniref:Galactose oxidase n=1 Tax=Roridomyces roridus TaxID=1738132 RepID=A0AAD7C074_9AGAR|nr:galactose oxidase [Roridomyces roridus]
MGPPRIYYSLALLYLSASTVARSASHRRQSVPTTLPGNWSSIGCYTDGNPRTLTGATTVDTTNMTVENCIAFCDGQNFIFAGVEFAQECYCDDHIENSGVSAPITDCNMACTGDPAESCGGPGRLNVFWSGVPPPALPSIPDSIGPWVSLGCFSDNVGGRALTATPVDGQVSLDTCTTACFNAGMPLSGTEFADECYCGTAIINGNGPIDISACNMVCAGNSTELCGGPNALTVFNFTGTNLPPPPPPVGGGPTGVTAIATDLPEPWAYLGCFVDGAHGRVLPNEIDNTTMTVEMCVDICTGTNFSISGLEFGVQCFCGNALIEGAVVAPDPNDCNQACGGNATQACGAGNRLSVYSTTPNVTIFPVPTVQNDSLPGSFVYQGCLPEPPNARVFPWELILTNNNSATACLGQCAAFGFTAAGMEFGSQCFCGDVTDVTAANVTIQPDDQCDNFCSGDPIHVCGGENRLTYYAWEGPTHVWNKPEVTGRYEFFVPGVVVPLIATLGINGKVAFLEKVPSQFQNSTGAYELDLSLVDQFDLAWREMHVSSDVFCSGSVILPDKGARILNVGGWSLDSTKGVRLYTPDGSAGVNGTNEWEENFSELHLQKQRWYPSAAVLPNGTVFVIGGETGANASPEPSAEILPTPEGGGDTTVFLDWLNRTDPNNLYPFVFALPSGNLFIGYYNEARIIDAGTFDTIIQFPNIPGAVNDFTCGRTYPMEGAAVIFPQHAPYTDPLEVLICGGSCPGAGIALDSCVSIQPEVENATWALERMPNARVMPNLVALPDGTFLILNGAVQGFAGFGLANDPNLGALLYDPTQPFNQRISFLNNTIVARLYHSEAILLPDGRVLVSGSDPESGVQPEEFRIEVYIPPYLATGLTQPSFTLTTANDTDWAYGSTHSIDITLHQGTTDTARASLIAATSSTHGNAMGSRTIFPAFDCAQNGSKTSTCKITAPPNANISPPGWHQLFILDGPTPSHGIWVRIGGDPAGMGNWPDLPGFTLPGV